MIVHVFDTPAQVARAAAAVFSAQILKKPDSVLGLATGGTPVDTYKELIKLHQDGILDFSQVTTFNLDEYEGLPTSHPESYVAFMKRNLFDHVNIKQSRLPDGLNKDHQKECAAYDEEIRQAGGVDLQLLGIGNNGHIGFNEPSDHFVYDTNLVDLTPSTIKANRRFFDSEDQVPRKALSMGIGTIMEARSILMIALGEGKAEVVQKMVEGDIDPQVPASILRAHKDVTVLLDRAAASKLSL
ncbi:MAG: glucosamine-6-phosphate deaminase [Clostridiales bacterium]|jgi:glucosamine-6-phosphate deaminase|nr:glucosamine-6-phosphate deaminase [Clostridiales bacterium]